MVKILVAIPQSFLKNVSEEKDRKFLESFSEVIWNNFDRNLTERELSIMIRDVDGCIISWGSPKISPKVLENANRLKIIGHVAGSIKPYICKEVFEKGIIVINAASEIAKSVAEYTLAMMMNSLTRIPQYIFSMKQGCERDFRRENMFYTRDLRDKNIGIIGFGNVARELIKLLKPFNVNIMVYDPYVDISVFRKMGVKRVSLKEVLSKSDIVTVHAASTSETYHMISEKELSLMKDGSILIYSSHGGIVDQKALIKEVERGRIYAVLDTFEEEKYGKWLSQDSILRKLDNVYLTPHIAGPTGERRRKLFGVIVRDFKRYFDGKMPKNVVKYSSLKYIA